MRCLLFVLVLALSLSPGGAGSAASVSEDQPLGIALESLSYPFLVRFLPLVIEGQDLRMAYMDVPARSAPNGRAVVLLHGKNFGGYYWSPVIQNLSAHGYRVIVPDQIGWGKSSKPDLRYSFQMLAANTARLLDALGVSHISLLGHSTGGMLAVRFALMYPERVSQLILEDPIGLEDYRVTVPPVSDEVLYQAELHNTDPQKIRSFYAHYFAEPQPAVYGPLAAVQIRVTRSGEYPRCAKSSALAYQMIYQQPVRYEYHLLRLPTLLIVGDQDRTAPLSSYITPELRERMGHFVEMARQATKEMPQGKVVIVPKCGHIPHLERPEEFQKALLAFLDRSRP